nr:unnamed protein product [Haemonchus contortus]
MHTNVVRKHSILLSRADLPIQSHFTRALGLPPELKSLHLTLGYTESSTDERLVSSDGQATAVNDGHQGKPSRALQWHNDCKAAVYTPDDRYVVLL